MKLRSTFIILCILTALTVNAQDKNDKKVYHSIILNVNGENVEVQALLLDSGRISLYKLIDYYIKVSTPNQSFIFKLISEDNQYISQLGEHMADCATLKKLIPKTKFNTKELTNIIRLYNNCSALDAKKLHRPIVSATFGVGLSKMNSSFTATDGYIQELDWSFKSMPTLYTSVALSPPRNKNISFGIGGSLSKRRLNGYSYEQIFGGTFERFLNMDYNQYTIDFQFINYVTRLTLIRPFYTLSIGKTFVSPAKTKLWEVTSFDNVSYINEVPSGIETKNCINLGITGGFKILIKNMYSVQFEFRFDFQANQVTSTQLSKSRVYTLSPIVRIGLK